MDMDKLLNRGKYSIQGEVNVVDEEVKLDGKCLEWEKSLLRLINLFTS